MSKYVRLRDRIENVFIGFYIDGELEEYPYIDLDKTDKDVTNNRLFGIDSFPKCMEERSPHCVLDVFWDLDKDKTRYFTQEEKFLRALLLIMSYSKEIIISDEYYFSENKKYTNKILNKEELRYLEVINDVFFDFEEIDFDYYAMSSLIKIALRERNSLTVYMLDLEIALDISGLYTNVYLGLKGNIELVKYICNIEGLYIRDTYLEE